MPQITYQPRRDETATIDVSVGSWLLFSTNREGSDCKPYVGILKHVEQDIKNRGFDAVAMEPVFQLHRIAETGGIPFPVTRLQAHGSQITQPSVLIRACYGGSGQDVANALRENWEGLEGYAILFEHMDPPPYKVKRIPTKRKP